MPECVRCGDFTDNPAEKDYNYCGDCLDHFAAIEERGVIVEQERGGDTHVLVTARDESFDGGVEGSQVDGLARGSYIAEETGLPAMFKYGSTGSRWDLEEYLSAHPGIRKKVHDRLRRVPEKSSDGFIARVLDHF